MMHILICEDDFEQRTHMEHVVGKHISDNEMELILSSEDPAEVLAYLKTRSNKGGLYFIDIDLKNDEIDGIELGVKIREADPFAKIVFITTHSELAYLTFQHKINAQDYIVKDSPEKVETKMIECMMEAYDRYQNEKSDDTKNFMVDANGEVWNVPYDEILFFETHPKIRHRIILHTENGKLEFRGFLSEIEKLDSEFYRCHKSYLLSINKVAYIDKKTKEAVMQNGARAHIAQKKMAEMVGIVGER